VPASFSRRSTFFRLGLLLVTVLLDQWTKWWARHQFSLPSGEPDYYQSLSILGDWLHFRLVFNHGAAFGMKPQSLLPFLHPTLFYGLFSIVAITILVLYYLRLRPFEGWLKSGVVLILSGAFGNLIDRVTMHKVTDFIDVGIPGFQPRWPTFNIADSCVCIGVGILLIAPMFLSKKAEGAPDHA
jgi:signal peptidase II